MPGSLANGVRHGLVESAGRYGRYKRTRHINIAEGIGTEIAACVRQADDR